VKNVVFLKSAAQALRQHRNMAPRIRAKIAGYAEGPDSLANRVTELRGSSLKRRGIGDFRILFEETATEIVVSKIGPRGSVYD
jgi:mRNA interferase RelE/StbE